MVYTSFNKDSFLSFKKKYQESISNNKKEFVFNNIPFDINYAKYLLEHLTEKFDGID